MLNRYNQYEIIYGKTIQLDFIPLSSSSSFLSSLNIFEDKKTRHCEYTNKKKKLLEILQIVKCQIKLICYVITRM